MPPASSNPQLIADVYFYPTEHGGRLSAIQGIYKCPCFTQKNRTDGWDCLIQVGKAPLSPGERRRLGFIFLSGYEAASALTKAKKFYLWDGGRFVAEADVVEQSNPN